MDKKIKKWIGVFWQRFSIFFFAAFMILTASVLKIDPEYSKKLLTNQMIRFHVVANSDTTEDQLLKQRVKDEVIEYIRPKIQECTSVDETREVLNENMEDIKEISKSIVEASGKEYAIYVALGQANFPTKSYGDVVFPAGQYEACRIIIGEGKGENWWCVMYPPLCYIDAASGVVPLEGKEQLKQGLGEEQYNLVANNQKGEYKIRFKLVDSINSFLYKENYKEKI